MTALSKYSAGNIPVQNSRTSVMAEFRRVEITTDSIVRILEALDVPIQIGPPNSGGVGFRALIIPN